MEQNEQESLALRQGLKIQTLSFQGCSSELNLKFIGEYKIS